MEKKEKKADLEQLLNTLIEKGFRPFWRYDKLMWSWRFWSRQFVIFWIFPEEEFTLRELVSINSWLWQFVCENGMIWRWDRITKRKKVKDTDSRSWEEVIYYSVIWSYNETDYQYRLIETALLDEKDIEKFLLDNIKIDE